MLLVLFFLFKDGAKWFELSAGAMKPLASKPAPGTHTFFAGDQGLFHARFPSGKVALECDTIERTLAVRDPKTGEPVRRIIIGGSLITRGTSILSMNRPKRSK